MRVEYETSQIQYDMQEITIKIWAQLQNNQFCLGFVQQRKINERKEVEKKEIEWIFIFHKYICIKEK